MGFVLDLLMEFMLEFSVELTKNKKVPGFIRYVLLGIIVIFFTAIVLGMLVSGILLLIDSQLIGFLFIGIAVIMAIGAKRFCQKIKQA